MISELQKTEGQCKNLVESRTLWNKKWDKNSRVLKKGEKKIRTHLVT